MQRVSPGAASLSASAPVPSRPMGVILFVKTVSLRKKQMLPLEGKNATSPFLNSVLDRSTPESILDSKYRIFFPSRWACPSKGSDLVIMPTVRGDRWRLR